MDLMVEATARRVFSNAHTYHINSISVNSDLQTFISTDDLRVNLWNLEITDRSFSILSHLFVYNGFRSALQSACYILKIHDGFLESRSCSLVPSSQTLWTSSQQTWRSWQKWSPQQSFIPSSVTPLPTAAARARYACVTWDRLRSVTSTANVSTCCTRVHHVEKMLNVFRLSFMWLFYYLCYIILHTYSIIISHPWILESFSKFVLLYTLIGH